MAAGPESHVCRECQSHLLDSVKTSVYIVYTTSVYLAYILVIWSDLFIHLDMIWTCLRKFTVGQTPSQYRT